MRFVVRCVREWSKYYQWCCSPVLSIVWNYDIYRAFWGAVMSYPPSSKIFTSVQENIILQLLAFVKPWYNPDTNLVNTGSLPGFGKDRGVTRFNPHSPPSTSSSSPRFYPSYSLQTQEMWINQNPQTATNYLSPLPPFSPSPIYLAPLISLGETRLLKSDRTRLVTGALITYPIKEKSGCLHYSNSRFSPLE